MGEIDQDGKGCSLRAVSGVNFGSNDCLNQRIARCLVDHRRSTEQACECKRGRREGGKRSRGSEWELQRIEKFMHEGD